MGDWIPATITGILALLGVIYVGIQQRRTHKETTKADVSSAEIKAKVDTTATVLLAWQAYGDAQNEQINHLIIRLEENEVRLRQSEERSRQCESEKGDLQRKFVELELKLAKANLLPPTEV